MYRSAMNKATRFLKAGVLTVLLTGVFFQGLTLYYTPISSAATTTTGFGISNTQRTAYSVSDTGWANVHDDATANATGGTYWQSYVFYKATHYKYQITRCYGFFDTSSIPDDAVVTGISFSFYVQAVEQTPFTIYVQNVSNLGADLSTSEYNIAYIKNNLSKMVISGTGYKNMTFTSNTSGFVNKTGWTYIVIRSGYDYNDTSPALNVKTNHYTTNFTTVKLWVTYETLDAPDAPVYFRVLSHNSSEIKLNWTKGTTGVDKTVIIANNTGYPTLDDCIVVYNGTGTYYNHTGLVNNTHWFYRCYSWNDTADGCYNTSYLQDHDTTMGRPIAGVNLDLNNCTGSYTQEYYTTEGYYVNTTTETYSYTSLAANCVDEDWDTFETINDLDSHYVTYAKPASYHSLWWTMKDGTGTYVFSLSEAMIALNASYIVISVTNTDLGTLDCYAHSTWGSFDLLICSHADFDFYEEAFIMNVSYPGVEGWRFNFTAESQLNLVNNSVNVTGTFEGQWNDGSGFWDVWANLTGITTVLTTNSFITSNLTVHNPNPGNGTHSTNYLRNDSGGLTTAMDIIYNNFTTPAAELPGDYDTTVTMTAFGSGENVQNISGVDYNTCRNNTNGQVVTGPLSVGQYENAGDYFVIRNFLKFDTSSIPEEATITSAHVALVVYQDDYTDVDFNITLQQVKAPAPHTPLISTDYYKAAFPSDTTKATMANKNISGYVDDDWFNMTLNASGLAWINTTGYTYFVMRSDQDVLRDEPGVGVNEWIQFYSVAGVTPQYNPRLVINYTVPGSNWQHIVNLTWRSNSSGAWLPYYTSHVTSNGTTSVPAVNFSGNTSYFWNVSYESNGTNSGVTQVWTFTTVNASSSGSGTVVLTVNGRRYTWYFTVGTFGGLILASVVPIFRIKKRKRER